jgi:hypothetical protein
MARRQRRGGGGPRALGDILDGTYPGTAEDRPLLQTFGWWDRTVPPRIAKHARPVALRHGTLVIHTQTSAWAQELSFHEADLLKSIRGRVGAVKRLRIRVGAMPRPPEQKTPRKPKVTPLALSELPSDVARALARVGDDDVRDILARAVCMSLAPAPKKTKPRT